MPRLDVTGPLRQRLTMPEQTMLTLLIVCLNEIREAVGLPLLSDPEIEARLVQALQRPHPEEQA